MRVALPDSHVALLSRKMDEVDGVGRKVDARSDRIGRLFVAVGALRCL